MSKLHFFGGANEVGASSTLVEIDGRRILVDAGIRMGPGKNSKWPDFGALDKPDALLLTHAHSDHTGALPLLARESKLPEKVYCTRATREIAWILFDDAQRREQDSESPEYDFTHICEANRRMVLGAVEWMKPVHVCDGVTARWIPAGHILGAAMIYIEGKRERILITGDVSDADQLTIPGLKMPDWCRPDVMVMESTYGDCPQHKNRAEEEAALIEDVIRVNKEGGKVLIPAFAVARSQEVILVLKDAAEREGIPVYVDGMVREVSDVYSRHINKTFYSEFVQKVSLSEERDRISSVSGPPCCIVASSGMLNGGCSNYYAKRLAGDPKNLIAITGYQAEGTPGRKLLDLRKKPKGDRVLNLDEREVNVKCDVKQYSLSAHADQKELTELVEQLSPHTCFLVHGDESATARTSLAGSVRERSLAVDVQLPENGGEYTYTKRAGIADGREFCRQRVAELYDYLVKAGAKGPFRVRELAEIWFGTERTTLEEEKRFRLILSTVWQTLFVQDGRSRDLFHLRPSV